MMISLLGYGCTSSAGPDVDSFWRGLSAGIDHSKPHTLSAPNGPTVESQTACLWSESSRATLAKTRIVQNCLEASRDLFSKLGKDLGIIFASSKGCVEDYIWDANILASNLDADPYTPCLSQFLTATGLKPKRSLSLSNACASSHVAIFLAKQWLQHGQVSQVLVLAADTLGPFTSKGFRALNALSVSRCRPFDTHRDGLQLGEAAAAILLGSESAPIVISGVATDSEGYAITRPSQAGESLVRAVTASRQPAQSPPSLVIAHGTGTVANDQVEDAVFSQCFGKSNPPVTSTKWSVGHSLGASGLLDIIAGAEVLKRQTAFRIANLQTVDPGFKANYLTATSQLPKGQLQSLLITSLGFGGVHAAVNLEMAT